MTHIDKSTTNLDVGFISDIIDIQYSPDYAINGGDFNINLAQSALEYSRSLLCFCNDHGLVSTNATDISLRTVEYSYCSNISNACSVIYYLIL